jgi:hypothetical protein
MTCSYHGHLPSPWQPVDCPSCHPERRLEVSETPGFVGTTSATFSVLSDSVSELTRRLHEANAEVLKRDGEIERLQGVIAELKAKSSKPKAKSSTGV